MSDKASTNYDLNIWDKDGYESEYEQEGWVINIYQYDRAGDPYGSGLMLEDKTIVLTPTEAKRLTLGWGTDLGGDYTPDSDFWIDKETFFDTYKISLSGWLTYCGPCQNIDNHWKLQYNGDKCQD
jgi:hypothetical protein